VSGEQMSGGSPAPIPAAQPGETVNVSVNFVAPAAPGPHRSNWRLRAANGEQFGQSFYVLIEVPGLPTPIPPPVTQVPPPPPPPPPQGCQGTPVITGFFVNPQNIQAGQTATLHWNLVVNADYASLQTPDGTSGIATPGNQNVSPRQTTTYTLAAYCKGNRVSSSVTVTVSNAPPTPPPFRPSEIFSIEAIRRGGDEINMRISYYWNGQDPPATMQGFGSQNGREHTETASRPIESGGNRVINLLVHGGNKINSVHACIVGGSGNQIACANASLQ
jgi:hypothetical protein